MESSQLDSNNVYGFMSRVSKIMALVKGHDYSGVSQCSAVLTLVWKGSVILISLNSKPKVG